MISALLPDSSKRFDFSLSRLQRETRVLVPVHPSLVPWVGHRFIISPVQLKWWLNFNENLVIKKLTHRYKNGDVTHKYTNIWWFESVKRWFEWICFTFFNFLMWNIWVPDFFPTCGILGYPPLTGFFSLQPTIDVREQEIYRNYCCFHGLLKTNPRQKKAEAPRWFNIPIDRYRALWTRLVYYGIRTTHELQVALAVIWGDAIRIYGFVWTFHWSTIMFPITWHFFRGEAIIAQDFFISATLLLIMQFILSAVLQILGSKMVQTSSNVHWWHDGWLCHLVCLCSMASTMPKKGGMSIWFGHFFLGDPGLFASEMIPPKEGVPFLWWVPQ